MKRFAHKIPWLSTVILILLLALPVAVLADSGKGGDEYIQTVNGYQLTLVFEEPAIVGSNQIHVRVVNAQNMPVPNGRVEVGVVKSESEHTDAYSAHSAHGQMADIPKQPAEVPPGGHAEMGMTALTTSHHYGEYAGEIEIDSAGDCVIRVHLTVRGELTEVDFPLNVAQPQNGSGILLGFLTVNVAIIAVAVILKPRPVSATLSKGA